MKCPHCSFDLSPGLKSVSLDTQTALPGDIILCGACGTPNILLLNDETRLLTEEEFSAMSKPEQRDLKYAVRLTLAAQRRAESEGKSKIITLDWLSRTLNS